MIAQKHFISTALGFACRCPLQIATQQHGMGGDGATWLDDVVRIHSPSTIKSLLKTYTFLSCFSQRSTRRRNVLNGKTDGGLPYPARHSDDTHLILRDHPSAKVEVVEGDPYFFTNGF
jgi:hypothetical protein